MDELMATCWTWSGKVDPSSPDPKSPIDPHDRIEALARHGFSGADFLVGDLRGRDLAGITASLDAADIRHRQVEFLDDWWSDSATDSVDEIVSLAGGIGATQIKVGPDTQHATRPFWDMRDPWVHFADRASAVGAQLVIEPLPFSNLRTIEDGARFVQGAGHPDAGIVVDFWHVQRGGSTMASLSAAVDPAHLMAVELCDGSSPKPPGVDMMTEAITARELPGEGSWDVRGFITTIRRLGFAGPWAVEMPTPWYLALPLDEALARAANATRSALAGTDD